MCEQFRIKLLKEYLLKWADVSIAISRWGDLTIPRLHCIYSIGHHLLPSRFFRIPDRVSSLSNVGPITFGPIIILPKCTLVGPTFCNGCQLFNLQSSFYVTFIMSLAGGWSSLSSAPEATLCLSLLFNSRSIKTSKHLNASTGIALLVYQYRFPQNRERTYWTIIETHCVSWVG